MKNIKILFNLCLLMFLAGCIDVEEDVWINTNDSCRLKIDIAIASSEVPIFGSGTKEENIKEYRLDMVKDMKEKEQNIRKIKYVKGIKISQSYAKENGGTDHFIYDIRLNNIVALNDVFQEIKRDQIEKGLNWDISAKKLDDGNILFVQTFANENVEQKINDTKKSSQEEKERFYNVRLHAPKIVKTNGRLDSRFKTAEWSIPFKELSDDHHYKKELIAEIKLPLIKSSLILTAIAIAICVIICIIISIKKIS